MREKICVLSGMTFCACWTDMKNKRISLSVMCSHGLTPTRWLQRCGWQLPVPPKLFTSLSIREYVSANARVLDLKFKFVRCLYSAGQLYDSGSSPVSVLFSNKNIWCPFVAILLRHLWHGLSENPRARHNCLPLSTIINLKGFSYVLPDSNEPETRSHSTFTKSALIRMK